MAVQIQLRRDTAANWTSENPTLAEGEVGFETDTGRLKIGDGVTAWTFLDYFVGDGSALLPKLATVQSYAGNRTLDGDDSGAHVRITAAGTVTLPDGLATGFQCVIVNATDSDTVALSAATTLTLPSGFEPEIQNRRAVTVIHVGSNVWEAHGALVEEEA